MTEIKTIQAIRSLFPAYPGQLNQVFSADAELVDLEGGRYALSIDEFSPEEDFFNDRDLRLLGRNLAVAVLSDILAVGSRPKFYLQAITEPHGRKNFAGRLSEGVSDILSTCGCYLLGGDLSRSQSWRYTGVAIGLCSGAEPLTRVMPARPQKLWVTGTLGDGNLCAFTTGREQTIFELRLKEAAAMSGLAKACLDTSGGLVEALTALRLVNPHHYFQIDSKKLPFDQRVMQFALENDLPLVGFAFGGAGEYELLFSTDENVDVDFATCIGRAQPVLNPGLYWDGLRLPDELPDPRSFPDKKLYVQALVELIRSCRI